MASPNQRQIRLVRLLSDAEQALAEAESLAAELPGGSTDQGRAIEQLAELRDAAERIERLLKTKRER